MNMIQGYENCCEDPVIHQKIDREVKMWLWKKAPGVRSSEGCPTKLMPFTPSLGKYLHMYTTNTFYALYIGVDKN